MVRDCSATRVNLVTRLGREGSNDKICRNLDHRHIYEQVGRLIQLGAQCAGYYTNGEPAPLAGFVKRFPELKRVSDVNQLFDDPSISLVVTAAIPGDRADIAVAAMACGKDVMTDKPGCTELADLERIKRSVAETDRIWSVNFSERFEVAAVQKAAELVAAGDIGRVVQTIGAAYGGILTDIASH